jgi:hypothetical protein
MGSFRKNECGVRVRVGLRIKLTERQPGELNPTLTLTPLVPRRNPTRGTAIKWHKMAVFGDLLCHSSMLGADSDSRLFSVRTAHRASDRKPLEFGHLCRLCAPDSSTALAHERRASGWSGDRGTNGLLCHRGGTCRRRSARGIPRMVITPSLIRVLGTFRPAKPELTIMLKTLAPTHGSQPGAQAGRHARNWQESVVNAGLSPQTRRSTLRPGGKCPPCIRARYP